MTFQEAAKWLRISDRMLSRLLVEESIPARKIGNKWRFSRTALARWIGDGVSQQYLGRDTVDEEAGDDG